MTLPAYRPSDVIHCGRTLSIEEARMYIRMCEWRDRAIALSGKYITKRQNNALKLDLDILSK